MTRRERRLMAIKERTFVLLSVLFLVLFFISLAMVFHTKTGTRTMVYFAIAVSFVIACLVSLIKAMSISLFFQRYKNGIYQRRTTHYLSMFIDAIKNGDNSEAIRIYNNFVGGPSGKIARGILIGSLYHSDDWRERKVAVSSMEDILKETGGSVEETTDGKHTK